MTKKDDTSSNERTTPKKKIHPLQMPLRISPTSNLPICRFHNYSTCKKHADPTSHCPLDHSTCHICLQPNNHHKALSCPQYLHHETFESFCQEYTLENTRRNDYPTKTALGDAIIWTDKLGYPDLTQTRPYFKPGDDQLLRCRKLKKKEAFYLSRLYLSSSEKVTFCDVGAHFGDTILTMALHAKRLNYDNIFFVAFEPNADKCAWIQKVALANDLQQNVKVYCVAVGDECKMVQPDPRRKERALLDGSLMYKDLVCDSSTTLEKEPEEEEEEECNAVEMITLDSLLPQLSPLGFLHIDVEGWESKVLKGAQTLLSSSSSEPCFIIAESWNIKQSKKRRGVSDDTDSEVEIEEIMKRLYPNFERRDDIVDVERNLVYEKKCEGCTD